MHRPSPSSPALNQPDPCLPCVADGAANYPPCEDLHAVIEVGVKASHAPRTRERYAEDWAKFMTFCKHYGYRPMPAEPKTAMLFFAFCATRMKPQSVKMARCAVRYAHLEAGLADPTAGVEIKRLLMGVSRHNGTPPNKKRALSTAEIRAMCRELDTEGGLVAIRDKAALLLGFSAASRASEITERCIQDVVFEEGGMRLLVARSKTDQEGAGITKYVVHGTYPETDPVLAMREWLDTLKARGMTEGWLFPALFPKGDRADRDAKIGSMAMTTQRYRHMLKRLAGAIGLDPATVSGHSVRRGHASQASRNNANRADIQKQGGWKSSSTMDGYIDAGRAYLDNSSAHLGL